MDSYIITITLIGIAALGMAWMPSFTKKTGISDSVVYVLLGAVSYYFIDILPKPDPVRYEDYTVHFTEFVIIISIMGGGLKIDRPFSLQTWIVPFRLLTITMVLCIFLLTMLSYLFLHFDFASSLLLGAALAPTDPVLAADVQVGPPLEKKKDNVRFALTAEAGMNDGMGFPFTWLAISVASLGPNNAGSILEWFAYDFIYKIIAGIIVGFLLGKFLGYLIFNVSKKTKFININDGFIAVASALLIYGLTELVHGYGFIAVFVAAVTLRNYEFKNEFHKDLHNFSDQVERILVAVVLLVFGGSLIHGILGSLTWEMAVVGIIFIFLIRPFSGIVGLMNTHLHFKEKLGISFYGIRGLGSFYYLSFALSQKDFLYSNELWSIVSFIVLLSIIVHGLTATRVMRTLESKFSEEISL
ncbi:cation:proton antiporter [Dyadobacter subterraneus]|uniref:Sodium:proton antiporter n=1 Tax=Dyadobacter subterraneus TaxID=2773304 RepID=A0ABR9W8P1_9BACT|nr:sodium:proton antiporter [Dyadobacter subterraneus]MBE9461849.1 sodium:proton antiporter [Dyadobacter subterraneus]